MYFKMNLAMGHKGHSDMARPAYWPWEQLYSLRSQHLSGCRA
jgi:hypothetical protein